ncbi:cell division topological specificity factor MinE [Tissierella sp. Yu-01]|jgi:cell division topological specificity factor|uniref:cell division topological specificity factor MinE n=1 Tax=Tissierella sp. Yu-01 TaxID=3035694 RepID=UPI00240DD0F7|nr:cell division topological specificity factor MinE [Tissierella sp. Yu-01]WFA09493.1 cell division topological specificity factor MinE [Tissierella sp. Yu-01]
MDLFKLFGRKQEQSKDVAKERLKLVLVHDRADLSPKLLDMMKSDIIRVISEYADIDKEGIDIKLTRMKRDGDTSPISALVANIPIVKVKDK